MKLEGVDRGCEEKSGEAGGEVGAGMCVTRPSGLRWNL